MGVASCLGVDDVDGPLMAAARAAWPAWCRADPGLAVVDDIIDLPNWTREAAARDKDALVARLVTLAHEDAQAAVVVAWLLLPGATRLANRLRDLTPDIDALTAGQLWLEIRSQTATRCVAATILRSVRRALLAELGLGDSARRSDPTWTNTALCEHLDDLVALAIAPEPVADPESEAGYFLQAAILDGAVTFHEVSLLQSLAEAADERWAPSRRGHAGLTAPAVVELVTRHRAGSERTARRHASALLARLGTFIRERRVTDDLRDFVATHDLPPVGLADFLELYFFDHFDEYTAAFRDTA